MDRADPVVACLDEIKIAGIQWFCVPRRSVEKHALELEDVIARLAVEHRALPAGIGCDHATDGCAVRRRELGGEEQTVWPYRVVELILHDAGLDPCPPLDPINGEDAVHVA